MLFCKPLTRWAYPVALAGGVHLALSMPLAFSAPGEVNSVNDGQNIQGGTYFNTPGSRTTFQNSGSGGLWLKSGSTVRGLESDAAGVPNGNGGTLHFRAPGEVVRLDGNIDVSGLLSGKGTYVGNGGKVFVDSAFLYQNGNIYANGVNGGQVHFNIGSATMGPNAKITAMGFGGTGGQIGINATDTVNIQQGAILDSSGRVIGTYDTNVINIEGGLVNNQGIIRANGVAIKDFKATNSDAAILQAHPNFQATAVAVDTASKGGTIRLVATGVNGHSNGTLINGGTLQANGSTGSKPIGGEIFPGVGGTAENGGTIILASSNHVVNSGKVEANGGHGSPTNLVDGQHGGHGGTVAVTGFNILNTGKIEANGGLVRQNAQSGMADGGQGGLVAFSYKTLTNHGQIQANGGNGERGGNGGGGGLVVFSGQGNPTGTGLIKANGGSGILGGAAGTLVAPNPGSFGLKYQALSGKSQNGTLLPHDKTNNPILATRRNELLVHLDNGILLSRNDAGGVAGETLSGRLADALIRTVDNPGGTTGPAFPLLSDVGNFVIGSPDAGNLALNLGTTPLNPMFLNLNTATFLVNGNLANGDAWIPGTHVVGPAFHDIWMSPGGGHLTWIATGDIINNGILLARGVDFGGSLALVAGRDIVNNRIIMDIAVNTHLLSGFDIDPTYVASHGGSMFFKAGRDIVNNDGAFINDFQAFYPLHRLSPDLAWPEFLNGAQIGANIQFRAGRDFRNHGRIAADALTYRNNLFGTYTPANAVGGVLSIRAGGAIHNTGRLSATGKSYFGNTEERFTVFPSDATPEPSQDGEIRLNGVKSSASVLEDAI